MCCCWLMFALLWAALAMYIVAIDAKGTAEKCCLTIRCTTVLGIICIQIVVFPVELSEHIDALPFKIVN